MQNSTHIFTLNTQQQQMDLQRTLKHKRNKKIMSNSSTIQHLLTKTLRANKRNDEQGESSSGQHLNLNKHTKTHCRGVFRVHATTQAQYQHTHTQIRAMY